MSSWRRFPRSRRRSRPSSRPSNPREDAAPQANASELEQGIKLLQDWADAAGEKMSSASRPPRRTASGTGGRGSASRDRRAGEDLGRRDPVPRPAGSRSGGPDADRPFPRAAAGSADSKSGTSKPAGEDEPDRDAEPRLGIESFIARHRSVRRSGPNGRSGAAHRNSGANAPPDATAQAQGRGRAGAAGEAAAARAEPERARLVLRTKTIREDCRGRPDQNLSIPSRSRRVIRRRSSWRRGPSSRWNGPSRSLKQKDRSAAYPPAEEARKILEEIQKAQPRRTADQQDQKQQDQNKKNEDQQKQDQKDQQKKDEQKKDQQKKDDEQKKDQQKKDQKKQKKQEEPKKSDEQKQDQPENSHRSRAIGSKKPCARSANGSKKSANATAR